MDRSVQHSGTFRARKTRELECHDCKYSWLMLGYYYETVTMEFFNHEFYCSHCCSLNKLLISHTYENNAFDIRLWQPFHEVIERFHCCGLGCSLQKFKLSEYKIGFIPSFVLLYFPLHRLCEKCYNHAMGRRSVRLDPKYCCIPK